MTESSQSNQPTHYVYYTQENKRGRVLWNLTGAAWLHKDGKGLSISMNNGARLIVREPLEEA